MKIYLLGHFDGVGGALVPEDRRSKWHMSTTCSAPPDTGQAVDRERFEATWRALAGQTISIGAMKDADCVVAYAAWEQGIAGYAHIAEIGIASVLEKPVLLVIGIPALPERCGNCDQRGADEVCPCFDAWVRQVERNDAMYNAYWLASCLPGVTTMVTQPEVASFFTRQLDRIQSPIELQLYLALLRARMLAVKSQYQIGKYTLDFAFEGARLAIECDGHDYHSSKEQRGHDAERDRLLMAQGWRTARFTGSQIFRDADECAAEVVALLLSPVAPIADPHKPSPVIAFSDGPVTLKISGECRAPMLHILLSLRHVVDTDLAKQLDSVLRRALSVEYKEGENNDSLWFTFREQEDADFIEYNSDFLEELVMERYNLGFVARTIQVPQHSTVN